MTVLRGGSTFAIIMVVVASGALAGAVHGSVNMAVIGPYIEAAIDLENAAMFEAGEAEDTPEFRAEYEAYREWQRGGQMLAGVLLGVAMGSLFGVVFALSRVSLPGRSHVTKAMVLAGVMWFALYVVPFLKYPPSPPAVGDPDTIAIRTALYVVLVAASGLGALCAGRLALYMTGARGHSALRGIGAGVALYAAIVSALVFAMPANPDPAPAINAGLLDGFRAASAVGVASFWASVAVFLGLLWPRLVKAAQTA